MANYVFWIFVSTRFHHQMQVPWHAQIRIFFSCACSFLPLSPAYFVIVWFLCVLSLVFCCHPTYLQQVLVPPAGSNAALPQQNPNHLPTHPPTIEIETWQNIRPLFETSHTPGIISRPQSTQWCFDVLCSLLACVTCFRDSLAWSWPGCVIGYGRGKFLRHPLIERKQDETLGRQTPQE